jgi:hypothetical protein
MIPLEPISSMAAGFLAVVVHPLVPAQTPKELVAYASPVSAPPSFAGHVMKLRRRQFLQSFHTAGSSGQYRDVHDMSAYHLAATVKADFCVLAG